MKDGVVEQLVNFCYSFTTQLAQSAQVNCCHLACNVDQCWERRVICALAFPPVSKFGQ